MRIGIAKKLMGSFIIGTILYAATVTVAYIIMEDLLKTVKEVKALSRNVELTGNLQLHLNKLLTSVSRYLLTGDIAERDRYDGQITQISAVIEDLKRYKGGEAWQESLRRVSNDTTILGGMAVELLYIEDLAGNEKAARLMEEMNLFSEMVIEGTNEFHRIALGDMKATEELARVKERRAEIAFFLILGISLMALPFLSLYLSRYVTMPLIVLYEGARAIEAGRLSHRIEVKTGDEIEALGDAFNEMAASLEKANREITTANIRLREIDRLKSEFLANMSHELRTPLTAIIGFSEILIDRVMGDLNEEQADSLNNIVTSGQHLLKLINDILDLSKIEAGKMELHLETFHLDSIIEFVNKTVSPLIEKKRQVLKTEVSEGIPPIHADPGRLKQILLNLTGNAIKFTPDGGTITIGAAVKGNNLALSVTDTGIGIKHEDIERIFQAFQQVEGAPSREYGGTGLGLTLTKRLAEMHGGKVEVESEFGRGSTFTVYIPVGLEKGSS